MRLYGWGCIDLEMSQERAECFLVGRILLPAGEVANMAMSTQLSSPATRTGEHGVIQTDRVEDGAVLLNFSVACAVDFVLHPLAVYRVFRKDKQELVLLMDGLINLFTEIITRLEIMRSEPTGNIFFAQIVMEALSNSFILACVADEKRLVLNRSRCEQRRQVLNLRLGETDPT